MKLILLGAPGCGKGTQAKIIEQNYGLKQISTGDLFRNALSAGTPIGKLAKSYMDSGQLVPDEVTLNLLKEKLEAESFDKGFMLDGFPRTIKQAEMLKTLMDIDLVLYFEIPEQVVIDRIAKRKFCSECKANYVGGDELKVCPKCGGKIIKRDDDNLEVAEKRLKVFKEQTYPLVEYYKSQNKLKTINANQDIELVQKEIRVLLGEV